MRSIAIGSRWPGFVVRLGLLLVLLVVTGCGSGRGKVSGRVLFHGEPLPGGWVNFRPADPRQNAVPAQLDEEGRYEAVLPVGEVKVSIDNRQLQPPPNPGGGLAPDLPLTPELRKTLTSGTPAQDRSGSPQAEPSKLPGRYVPIPEKYYTLETSNLQLTVSGGNQEHDFELTD
jgi:hypothetical protein